MSEVNSFVFDLTLVFGSSAIGGFIANRLRQPVLLGYLACGLAIGPFGLGLINNVEDIQSLAAIGVALLLFALGVEFSLAELKRHCSQREFVTDWFYYSFCSDIFWDFRLD